MTHLWLKQNMRTINSYTLCKVTKVYLCYTKLQHITYWYENRFSQIEANRMDLDISSGQSNNTRKYNQNEYLCYTQWINTPKLVLEQIEIRKIELVEGSEEPLYHARLSCLFWLTIGTFELYRTLSSIKLHCIISSRLGFNIWNSLWKKLSAGLVTL